MDSSTPRGWLFLLKLIISIGLVSWIIKDVDFVEVVEVVKHTDITLLIIAFCLFFLGYFLTAIRWRLLMSIHRINPPLIVLVQSFMVGIFFNNFLPSTIGGDVSRMYDVWRIAKDKTSAVSVVLVDRFMGILALILWATLAVLISAEIRSIAEIYIPIFIVLCAAICLAAFIFGRPRRLINMLTGKLSNFVSGRKSYIEKPVGKVLQAFGPYYNHNAVLLKALFVSLLLQLNVIIHFWLIGLAMDLDVSFFAMCVIIPCALMIMMLPISVNAIGVREVTFVYFMSFFGVNNESALVFAWIAFTFVLFQGLLGGIVFALRRAPPDLSQQSRPV
ncbi:MAG: lysylphosphatidylglycerol synthase transmembrane domain-containing protein [Arenicellales bacterium]|nr:lysylphosphatidylglycerol synthase transmembrane domain-containing protein [Arenicellales bacterium]